MPAKEKTKKQPERVIEIDDPRDDPYNILCYLDVTYSFMNMLLALQEDENEKVHEAFSNASNKDVATLRLMLSLIKERIEEIEKNKTIDSKLSRDELIDYFFEINK